ncbi:MAG: aerotaxis receptor [Sulfurimonas sp.]|jgi:aerotaxis receptor|uniref:PAS domain S-box protein n=1 Tax=Sulfurimonas sp. TaxID=2022749 RepID=UPI0039E54542
MQITSRANTEGIIIHANKNFCKLSGYSEAELVGFSHNKIHHPDMDKKEGFLLATECYISYF